MSDFEADMAVFESMPDTATKDEIREAIEQARHNRAERDRLLSIARDWGALFQNLKPLPEEWDSEHSKVVNRSLKWLVETAFPEVKP